ncbi:NmrA family NAD(P)-binding protein [Kitasatospora sp. NPDC054939]
MTADTNQTTTPATVLVVGGNGKTGSRVAERLTARGVKARIASRSAETAFDWTDPTTWDAALEGADAAYLTYYPDLAFPGAVEAVGALARRAVAAGVRRLVLLSGRGEEAAFDAEQALQDAVRATGTSWTVVRCAWFNQNFSDGFFLEPVLSGELALPVGDAVEPFVDVEDIADVAVAALLEDGHDGEVYELTGPRLLGFAEVAEELSRATGRPIAFRAVELEDFRQYLVEAGLPGDFADLFTLILDGRNASLADGVQRALGREPRDFADYVRQTAATGIWNA